MKMSIATKIATLIDRRDELIYKRLAGEKLSWVEKRYFDFLDKVLGYTLPKPGILPEKMKATIEEINVLVKERK